MFYIFRLFYGCRKSTYKIKSNYSVFYIEYNAKSQLKKNN